MTIFAARHGGEHVQDHGNSGKVACDAGYLAGFLLFAFVLWLVLLLPSPTARNMPSIAINRKSQQKG